MIMVGDDLRRDANIPGTAITPTGAQQVLTNYTGMELAKRHWHLTGANSVFCDGHVEFMRDADLYGATDIARRRWNNDHAPHPEAW